METFLLFELAGVRGRGWFRGVSLVAFGRVVYNKKSMDLRNKSQQYREQSRQPNLRVS